MSWASDAWDWGVDQVSDSGDWIDRNFSLDGGWLGDKVYKDGGFLGLNWDNIGGAINAGRGLWNAFDANSARSGARSDYLNILQNMAAQDQAYNNQYAQWQQGQYAAAAQNAAAQQAAARKALAIQKKFLKKLRKEYEPFVKSMKFLTPKMTGNYAQFLDTTALLNQYLTPIAMKGMGKDPTPSWMEQVPESAYSAGLPTSKQNVEFPSVEQIFARGK